MSELLSIKEYKTKRSIKKLLEELEVVNKVMTLSINGLSRYSKFKHVAEAISSLKTNKTLLEISYNKYKRMINEQKS